MVGGWIDDECADLEETADGRRMYDKWIMGRREGV